MNFDLSDQKVLDSAVRTIQEQVGARVFEASLKFCNLRAHFQKSKTDRFNRYIREQIWPLTLQQIARLIKDSWPNYLPIMIIWLVLKLNISPYDIVFGMKASKLVELSKKKSTFKMDDKFHVLFEEKSSGIQVKTLQEIQKERKQKKGSFGHELPGIIVWHNDNEKSEFWKELSHDSRKTGYVSKWWTIYAHTF